MKFNRPCSTSNLYKSNFAAWTEWAASLCIRRQWRVSLGKELHETVSRPILVTENAYLITGHQEYDESVKTYLVFGVVDFACLQLQCCFHRKKQSP